MKYSLKSKLSLSYVIMALFCVFSVSILTNILLDKHFREYVKNIQEKNNHEVVKAISQQYHDDGRWNQDAIEGIGINALENGLIIKVKDAQDQVLWDARIHNNGMCQRIIEHMAHNMSLRYPDVEGGYVEETFPVMSKLNQVGSVDIGYYGPFYLSDHDLAFISTLNKLLASVGIVSLLFALVLGAVMAKRLSMPISRVIDTAQMISKGYYEDRIREKSSTKEINQLTNTINGLAETLENQEKLRKNLTSDVAHELRTPLATLQSHMEAMVDGIWEPDVKRLKSCHEEIMRINRMVGDLEKLARVESENLVLYKEAFDISEQIEKMIQHFEKDFLNKNIEVEFEGKKGMVFADKDKISQVIVNLLSNAQKYTPEGGKVQVNVKRDQEQVQISVKDNGIGISEEDLPNVFERFYRADKSRNRLTGGAGIGLTIVKAIVKAHKGKVFVRSTLREGSEFIVSLPREKKK